MEDNVKPTLEQLANHYLLGPWSLLEMKMMASKHMVILSEEKKDELRRIVDHPKDEHERAISQRVRTLFGIQGGVK